MPEPELFLLVVRPLEQAAIRYIFTGSVAGIFYVEPYLHANIGLTTSPATSVSRKSRPW
jgi:hypothetical protein